MYQVDLMILGGASKMGAGMDDLGEYFNSDMISFPFVAFRKNTCNVNKVKIWVVSINLIYAEKNTYLWIHVSFWFGLKQDHRKGEKLRFNFQEFNHPNLCVREPVCENHFPCHEYIPDTI